MSEETKQAPESHDTAVRCGNCNASMRARGALDGLKCPNCRSTDLREVPVIGGAIEYTCADRRHGTTAADVMLAEWAKWCGYLTPNQYNTAMHRQNSELQASGAARPIHEVWIDLGFIDEHRVEGLLRFLCRKRPDADDEDFLARLGAREDVDPAQVKQVAALQRKMAARRNEVPPVAQLLVQRHVLTEGQMLEVLQAQSAEGRGAKTTALAMSQAPVKESPASRLVRQAKGSPRAVATLALAVVLGLLATGLWAWQIREKPVYVVGRCSDCEGLVKVEWSVTDWPARCPRCGRQAVRYALICPNGHLFTRESPFTFEACPECGAGHGRPLTEEEYMRLGHYKKD